MRSLAVVAATSLVAVIAITVWPMPEVAQAQPYFEAYTVDVTWGHAGYPAEIGDRPITGEIAVWGPTYPNVPNSAVVTMNSTLDAGEWSGTFGIWTTPGQDTWWGGSVIFEQTIQDSDGRDWEVSVTSHLKPQGDAVETCYLQLTPVATLAE